jgi:gamma-glutamyltranspeptidase/glutathione hydrolase
MPSSGIYTVTVPGAVKGWEMMRARFGKLPMADLLAPAISTPRRDFRHDVIRESLERRDAQVADRPACRRSVSAGRARTEFRRGLQESGARGTMRLIAEKGPAGFYEGKTADAILAVSKELGGTMTAADLKEYQPEWVEPISTTIAGGRCMSSRRTRKASRR